MREPGAAVDGGMLGQPIDSPAIGREHDHPEHDHADGDHPAAMSGTPNLAVTNVLMLDGQGNYVSGVAPGEMVQLRAIITAQNYPSGQPFDIEFDVAGFPIRHDDQTYITHDSTNWWFTLTGWYQADVAMAATVTIDVGQDVAESDETDNTFTRTLTPDTSIGRPSLRFPVRGGQNGEYDFTNHVDVDPRGQSDTDFRGGAYQYDGHTGWDLGPGGFEAQDDGIEIVAAAGGTVVDAADGHFDRQTTWGANQPPNYVILDHGDGWATWYWHLAEDTVAVEVGDTVGEGQLLGLMGSSGFSTGSHLHFEVRRHNRPVETMYDTAGYWQTSEEPVYEPETLVEVTRSTVQDRLPTYSREGFGRNGVFSTSSGASDLVYAAFQFTHLIAGDVLRWNWIRPDGTTRASLQNTVSGNHRSGYYRWGLTQSYLGGDIGTWTVELEYDGRHVATEQFEITAAAGPPQARLNHDASEVYVSPGRRTPFVIDHGTSQTFTLHNVGESTMSVEVTQIPNGFHVQAPASVPAGGQASVTVTAAGAVGQTGGTIALVTGDPDLPEYRFDVETLDPTGTTTAAVIAAGNYEGQAWVGPGRVPRGRIAPDLTITGTQQPRSLWVEPQTPRPGESVTLLTGDGIHLGREESSGVRGVFRDGMRIADFVPFGDAAEIVFADGLTAADAEQVGRRVGVFLGGAVPPRGKRTFQFIYQDTDGFAPAVLATLVANRRTPPGAATVNSPPQISAPYVIDAPTTVDLFPQLQLSDPDGHNLIAAAVRLDDGWDPGDSLDIVGTLPAGIAIVGYDPGSRTLRLYGSASAAAYRQALMQVQLTSAARGDGETMDVSLRVWDAGSPGDPAGGEAAVGTTVVVYPIEDADDQISEATPIAFDWPVTDNIENPGDVDIFSFTAAAGQFVSIDVDAASDLDSALRLFDAAGNQIAFSDNDPGPHEGGGPDAAIHFAVPASGTYYAAVSSAGNGAYDPLDGTGDAGGTSDGGYDLTLTLTSDRPHVDRLNGSVRYVENRRPVTFARSARVGDDDADFGGGQLIIQADGSLDDRVGLLAGNGVKPGTAVFGEGSGVITIARPGLGDVPVGDVTYSGTAIVVIFRAGVSRQDVQRVLRNAAYANDSELPAAQSRISARVADGDGNWSPEATTLVNLVSLADNPVIAGILPTPEWTEGSGPVPLTGVVSVSDVDTSDWAGARLDVLVRTPREAEDRFLLDAAADAGVSISGTAPGAIVSIDGRAVAELDRGAAAIRLVLDFLPGATTADVGRLASLIRFDSASDAPQGPKTVRFTLSDPGGGRGVVQQTLVITPVNDPPAILNVAGRTAAVNAGGAVRVLASSFTIDDPDYAGGGGTLSVSIPGNSDGGLLVAPDPAGRVVVSGSDVSYLGTPVGSLSGGGTGTLSVSFNAAATFAAVRSVGRLIAYDADAAAPARTLSVEWDFADEAGAAAPTAVMSLEVRAAAFSSLTLDEVIAGGGRAGGGRAGGGRAGGVMAGPAGREDDRDWWQV